MKTKKFNHNKIETCRISKKDIDTDKENYSVILDCVGKSINAVGFYKKELLIDLIKGKGKKKEKTLGESIQDNINKNLGIGGTVVDAI